MPMLVRFGCSAAIDALANVAVIVAAGLVAWFNSAWPDLIVAGVIALLFLHSAWEIISEAGDELRAVRT